MEGGIKDLGEEQVGIQKLSREYVDLSEELNKLLLSMKDGDKIEDRKDILDMQSRINATWEKIFKN